MSTVRDLLNHIWSEFRKVGIANDLTIIEHIAAYLLEINQLESYIEQSRKLTQANLNTDVLRGLLFQATEIAGGAEKLLNHHVLFRLPNMLPGGRYPTPRHIAESMIRLAQVEPKHSVADFACGSGGLLVNYPVERKGVTFGIDISPEWVEIAQANIKLHGINANIKTRNALRWNIETDAANASFDRILMNPPFGEKIDTNLAREILGKQVGSRSETALLTLALQKLSPEGRAAILIPSGLLFSNSSAERFVRSQLVDENSLEAVISFPKDAFQPYSPLQTHLLLFSKIKASEENITWFLQAEQDGYLSGRGRDLTQEPSQPSDLPFVEKVMQFTDNTKFDFLLPETGNLQVGIKKIIDDDKLLGFICKGIEQSSTRELSSVDLYPKFEQQSAFLLVEIKSETAQESFCIQIPLDGSEPSLFENRIEQIKKIYKLKQKDPEPVTRLLSNPALKVAIAINSEDDISLPQARILGVAVQNKNIHNHNYDLRPESYIGKQQEFRPTKSPSELLAEIYRNQKEVARRIDNLFGHLELPPIAQQQIPSLLVSDAAPFGNLSLEQKAVWEQVRQKTKPINQNDPNSGLMVVYFTPQDIEITDNEELADTTNKTLELLECMGVIVPVTIENSDNGNSIGLYRRLTERDLWYLDSEISD